MGLWLALLGALAVGFYVALWPLSPAAERVVQVQAQEPLWRTLGLIALPATLLMCVGWIVWSFQTGDWRYAVLGLSPILINLITLPIKAVKVRRERARQAEPLMAAAAAISGWQPKDHLVDKVSFPCGCIVIDPDDVHLHQNTACTAGHGIGEK